MMIVLRQIVVIIKEFGCAWIAASQFNTSSSDGSLGRTG